MVTELNERRKDFKEYVIKTLEKESSLQTIENYEIIVEEAVS